MMKFICGTLFNVLMGVVLANVVGMDPAYGAATGAVVPAVLGNFMPLGAAFEGVYTEVWTGELVKRLNAGLAASFLNGIPDYSAKAENEVIHLVDVGGDPDVLINNTTYPIPVQNLTEGDIPIGLDKYQTKATRVTDDQLYAISYDKFSTDVQRHSNAIDTAKYKKAIHALSPYSNTKTTPVVPTSGEADATGRKKMTRKDVIALKRAFDKAEVPTDGRRLVLCPDHINDFLEEDQKFREQYYNYTTGKVTNMYGFEIYEFVNCPYFTNAGVKVPFETSPAETDMQASVAFYVPRMFRAQGSTKMYYNEARTNPQTQESLVNFRHYEITMPKKQEAIGAIYSYDGKTAQTSDAEVTADKHWAQIRREAAVAAAKAEEEKAGPLPEDAGEELEA